MKQLTPTEEEAYVRSRWERVHIIDDNVSK
jgi:hypothetical protein